MAHKIMVVDDHSIVRAGLRQMLEDSTDIVVDAEAASGQEALDLLKARTFDGVLLDLSMPDRNGIDVLRRMKSERPTVPVLIVSGHAEEHYAMAVLKAGAHGYITKSNPAAEILSAVRTVLAGKKYFSPAMTQHIASVFVGDPGETSPHDFLTAREFEVFEQLASGKTVGEIADGLFLSGKTVSTHRTRVLGKLGMRTNADLTYYAIKNGFIE